jgi:hypothetical protein
MSPGNHSPTDSHLPQNHQSIELSKTQIGLNKDALGERALPPCSLEEDYQAFYRDLPQLLLEHPRQWVAYAGGRRIPGSGHSQIEVYSECLRRGYEEGEFLIQCVNPEPDTIDIRQLQDR